jgi:hypothetical protein
MGWQVALIKGIHGSNQLSATGFLQRVLLLHPVQAPEGAGSAFR